MQYEGYICPGCKRDGGGEDLPPPRQAELVRRARDLQSASGALQMEQIAFLVSSTHIYCELLLQLSHDNILQFLGVDKRGEGLQVQNHHHYQHHHYQHHHYDGSGGILSTTWISKIYLILSQVEFWLVTIIIFIIIIINSISIIIIIVVVISFIIIGSSSSSSSSG